MNTQSRHRRRIRIRAKVKGTSLRPRAAVFRSLRAVSVQIIDDTTGKTLAAVHGKPHAGVNKMSQAKEAGAQAAVLAKAAGITQVVFDRGGYQYKGRVREAAEGMREGGLKF